MPLSPTERIKQLNEIAAIINKKTFTQEDGLKFMKVVLAQLKKWEEELAKRMEIKTQETEKKLGNQSQEFAQVIARAKRESDSTLGGIRRRMMERINSLFAKNMVKKRMAKVDDKMKEVDEKMTQVRSGKDGIDGRHGIDGKDGSPDTPEQIADKLETLDSDKRLKIEAIKGLKDKLEELDKKPTGRVGGARKVVYLKVENLSSQCDGSTKEFTMPKDCVEVVAVYGTQFPINFNKDVDWTFEGRTLTLTDEVNAPETGQTLYALINCLFYG